MKVKLNPEDFPVATRLVRIRNEAAKTTPTRPEAMGCYFVLNSTWALEFLQERLRVVRTVQYPLVGDLATPLAVIDNMPVVHRQECPGLMVVLPENVPAQTDMDRTILRGIYNGIAKGAS